MIDGYAYSSIYVSILFSPLLNSFSSLQLILIASALSRVSRVLKTGETSPSRETAGLTTGTKGFWEGVAYCILHIAFTSDAEDLL